MKHACIVGRPGAVGVVRARWPQPEQRNSSSGTGSIAIGRGRFCIITSPARATNSRRGRSKWSAGGGSAAKPNGHPLEARGRLDHRPASASMPKLPKGGKAVYQMVSAATVQQFPAKVHQPAAGQQIDVTFDSRVR